MILESDLKLIFVIYNGIYLEEQSFKFDLGKGNFSNTSLFKHNPL